MAYEVIRFELEGEGDPLVFEYDDARGVGRLLWQGEPIFVTCEHVSDYATGGAGRRDVRDAGAGDEWFSPGVFAQSPERVERRRASLDGLEQQSFSHRHSPRFSRNADGTYVYRAAQEASSVGESWRSECELTFDRKTRRCHYRSRFSRSE